jgi:hypothetical protein
MNVLTLEPLGKVGLPEGAFLIDAKGGVGGRDELRLDGRPVGLEGGDEGRVDRDARPLYVGHGFHVPSVLQRLREIDVGQHLRQEIR